MPLVPGQWCTAPVLDCYTKTDVRRSGKPGVPVGLQVASDTGPRGLDASVTTDQNPCDTLCRIVGTYDNTLGGVFRTCSWVTCGSLATTTDRLLGAGRVLCGSPQGVDNVAAPLYNLSPP